MHSGRSVSLCTGEKRLGDLLQISETLWIKNFQSFCKIFLLVFSLRSIFLFFRPWSPPKRYSYRRQRTVQITCDRMNDEIVRSPLEKVKIQKKHSDIKHYNISAFRPISWTAVYRQNLEVRYNYPLEAGVRVFGQTQRYSRGNLTSGTLDHRISDGIQTFDV